MPGMLKTVSVRIAPPRRMPRSRPRTVTTGVIAERSAVADDHARSRQALRARGADVVLATSPRAGSSAAAARRSRRTPRRGRSTASAAPRPCRRSRRRSGRRPTPGKSGNARCRRRTGRARRGRASRPAPRSRPAPAPIETRSEIVPRRTAEIDADGDAADEPDDAAPVISQSVLGRRSKIVLADRHVVDDRACRSRSGGRGRSCSDGTARTCGSSRPSCSRIAAQRLGRRVAARAQRARDRRSAGR